MNNEVLIFSGKRGSGVTTAAIDFLFNATNSGIACAFVNTDMSEFQLYERLLCKATQIDYGKFAIGTIDSEELQRAERAKDYVNSLPVTYIQTDMAPDKLELVKKISEFRKNNPKGFLIVDINDMSFLLNLVGMLRVSQES